MDVEKIRELRLAHPFRPFDLILDDGRRLPVDQPYYLGISPTKRFIVHESELGPEAIAVTRIRDVSFETNGRALRSPEADWRSA